MQPFPYRIFVEWSAEDEAFIGRVPALGAMAHGDTAEDATREARMAAEGMLVVLRNQKKAAPPPDVAGDFSGRVLLRLPRSLHEQIALRAEADGVSLNQELLVLLSGAMGTLLGPTKRAGKHRPTG